MKKCLRKLIKSRNDMARRKRRRITIGKTSEDPAKNPLNNYVAKYAAQFGATAKTHRDKTKYHRPDGYETEDS